MKKKNRAEEREKNRKKEETKKKSHPLMQALAKQSPVTMLFT
jgi:hypothetical protein